MTSKNENAVAVAAEAQLPAELMEQMGAMAGVGVSDNPNDVGIPYWAILQDLSPQVKKRDERYIEGAEVGMMFNTATMQVIDGAVGIDFIPCFFEGAQVEWVPRASGGGFVAKHPLNTPLTQQLKTVEVDGKKVSRLPSGNDLVETRYWYGFSRAHVEDEAQAGPWEPAVVSMSSTMLKSSREWMGMVKRQKLPNGADAAIFSRVYTLTTALRQKNNNDWFVWSVASRRWVTAAELQQAVKFHQDAASGAVQVQQPDVGGAAPAEDEDVV